MRTKTKIWLITATSLLLLGCMLFAGVMTALKWDFKALETVKFQTNSYEFTQSFDSISIITDTADVLFAPSDDENCRVECLEKETARHSVAVKNNTLTVEKSPYNFIRSIGLSFTTPKITIYLPKAQYTSLCIKGSTGDIQISKDFSFGSVKISLSTGDIRAEHISADTLNLKVTTGRIWLTDVLCKSLISNGSTGDIYLSQVISTERISIERSTGDVTLDGCDANEICIETDTGDVTGSLLTDKVFFVETDTGDIRIPKTATGGRCEIETDTGDIKIQID